MCCVSARQCRNDGSAGPGPGRHPETVSTAMDHQNEVTVAERDAGGPGRSAQASRRGGMTSISGAEMSPSTHADMINALIVGDDVVARLGLRTLLQVSGKVTVAAEAGAGPECLTQVRRH